jgi:putative flippase GtrA
MPPAEACARVDSERTLVLRYVVNGLVATAVHFGVLTFNLHVLGLASAGVANLLAACAGILVSFLGGRFYVYRRRGESMWRQGTKFVLLYASIACLHGAVLYLWTDVGGFDYRVGFLLATGVQVMLSYWGNRAVVFTA